MLVFREGLSGCLCTCLCACPHMRLFLRLHMWLMSLGPRQLRLTRPKMFVGASGVQLSCNRWNNHQVRQATGLESVIYRTPTTYRTAYKYHAHMNTACIQIPRAYKYHTPVNIAYCAPVSKYRASNKYRVPVNAQTANLMLGTRVEQELRLAVGWRTIALGQRGSWGQNRWVAAGARIGG